MLLFPPRFSGDVVRLSLLSLLTPSPAERAGGLRPEVSGGRDGVREGNGNSREAVTVRVNIPFPSHPPLSTPLRSVP